MSLFQYGVFRKKPIAGFSPIPIPDLVLIYVQNWPGVFVKEFTREGVHNRKVQAWDVWMALHTQKQFFRLIFLPRSSAGKPRLHAFAIGEVNVIFIWTESGDCTSRACPANGFERFEQQRFLLPSIMPIPNICIRADVPATEATFGFCSLHCPQVCCHDFADLSPFGNDVKQHYLRNREQS